MTDLEVVLERGEFLKMRTILPSNKKIKNDFCVILSIEKFNPREIPKRDPLKSATVNRANIMIKEKLNCIQIKEERLHIIVKTKCIY